VGVISTLSIDPPFSSEYLNLWTCCDAPFVSDLILASNRMRLPSIVSSLSGSRTLNGFEYQVTIRPQLDRRILVAWVKHSMPIRGFGSLTQHQEELQNARLAGTVAAEKDCDWSETNPSCIPPSLEIPDRKLR
jgi:hypothetical protein